MAALQLSLEQFFTAQIAQLQSTHEAQHAELERQIDDLESE